jgi:hypothetical protein
VDGDVEPVVAGCLGAVDVLVVDVLVVDVLFVDGGATARPGGWCRND